MARNENLIRSFGGLDSGVFIAPVGTTAPTDLTTTLPVAWKELGWLEESGITPESSVDSDLVKAYQGMTVVRELVTGVETSWTATCLEQNPVVADVLYRGQTPTTTTGVTKTVVKNQGVVLERAVVIHVEDGAVKKRICIPKASLKVTGQGAFSGTEVATTEIQVVPVGEWFVLDTAASGE